MGAQGRSVQALHPCARQARKYARQENPDFVGVYDHLDELGLRPQGLLRNDFADGTYCAEIIHFYAPHVINLNWFDRVISTPRKAENWRVIQKKVLKKHFKFELPAQLVEDVTNRMPGAAECCVGALLHVLLE